MESRRVQAIDRNRKVRDTRHIGCSDVYILESVVRVRVATRRKNQHASMVCNYIHEHIRFYMEILNLARIFEVSDGLLGASHWVKLPPPLGVITQA